MEQRRPYQAEEVSEDSSSDQAPRKQSVVDEKTGIEETVHHVQVEDVQVLAEKLGERQDGIAPVDDIEFVMDKIELLTIEECRRYTEQFLIDHKYDYNLAEAQRQKLVALLAGPLPNQTNEEWELEFKSEIAISKFYSPYPEVRAITTPEDDPSIPCETLRAHLLGYCWAVIGQFVNSLFNSRYPAINLTSAVAQVLLYPCGKFLAAVLPDWKFRAFGSVHSLNPGPWTFKEQMLSTIILDVSITSAYVFWNIQTQTVFYHDTWLTPGYKILLLLSTQMMGLGFAGLMRRFVIYPYQTIWPSILPTLALNKALLVSGKPETIHGWSWSRYKFFWIFFCGMFVYFWFPDFIWNSLSYFTWMTWIAPKNYNLNMITGGLYGLGFNPISSFDWNVFATYTYPLTYPFWSFTQQYVGAIMGGLVIIGMVWSNYKWTAYLPPNSSSIFDNTGAEYEVSTIVNGDGTLIESAYKAYSPPFYAAGNLVVYGAFFAFYPFTMVFVLLDEWRPIGAAYRSIAKAGVDATVGAVRALKRSISALAKGQFKLAAKELYNALEGEGSIYDSYDDPFTRMMRAYPEVPDWWFLSIALISFIFAIIILVVYKELGTPVWTIFFVVGINLVFLVPMTYLYAISGTTEGLNVVTELIIGYALPGHPQALMFVKAFGYNINGQSDNYISDQKMGLYAKIPPRAMYRGQVIGSFLACFVCYGVVNFVDNDIQGICTTDQKAKFNCENGSLIYYASSVMWGAIGPKRTFHQTYPELKWTFLVGFLLALVWWTVKRAGYRVRNAAQRTLPAALFKPLNTVIFTPISWLKNVHPSLIFNGFLYWAPLNLTYWTTGFYFSAFFMYYLKRYKTAWWEKYNYVLAAAFTGGVALSGIIIFFAVQFHPITLSWWGNNVIYENVDGGAYDVARITDLPTRANGKKYFGPETWY